MTQRWRDRLQHLTRDETGTASTTGMVLCVPVLSLMLFAGLQASAWAHTRAEARAVARDTAALIARHDTDPSGATTAATAATATLTAVTNLANPIVTVDTTGDIVTVTITGQAPGIIRGTSTRVTASASFPIEQWVTLP